MYTKNRTHGKEALNLGCCLNHSFVNFFLNSCFEKCICVFQNLLTVWSIWRKSTFDGRVRWTEESVQLL